MDGKKKDKKRDVKMGKILSPPLQGPRSGRGRESPPPLPFVEKLINKMKDISKKSTLTGY